MGSQDSTDDSMVHDDDVTEELLERASAVRGRRGVVVLLHRCLHRWVAIPSLADKAGSRSILAGHILGNPQVCCCHGRGLLANGSLLIEEIPQSAMVVLHHSEACEA
jgi:hypothetical protein